MKPFFTYADTDVIGSQYLKDGGTFLIGVPAISPEKANRFLQERGKVVYAKRDGNPRQWLAPITKNNIPIASTHQALLINIEPIMVKDSAEKFVRDWLETYGTYSYAEMESRAKALLAKKGE